MDPVNVVATCARHWCRNRLVIHNEVAHFEGRRLVDRLVTTQLVVSLILSRFDYCNSLVAGLPLTSLELLQRVQNAAARIVPNLHPSDHLSTAVKQLHWLPAEFRVTYKLCSVTLTCPTA